MTLPPLAAASSGYASPNAPFMGRSPPSSSGRSDGSDPSALADSPRLHGISGEPSSSSSQAGGGGGSPLAMPMPFGSTPSHQPSLTSMREEGEQRFDSGAAAARQRPILPPIETSELQPAAVISAAGHRRNSASLHTISRPASRHSLNSLGYGSGSGVPHSYSYGHSLSGAPHAGRRVALEMPKPLDSRTTTEGYLRSPGAFDVSEFGYGGGSTVSSPPGSSSCGGRSRLRENRRSAGSLAALGSNRMLSGHVLGDSETELRTLARHPGGGGGGDDYARPPRFIGGIHHHNSSASTSTDPSSGPSRSGSDSRRTVVSDDSGDNGQLIMPPPKRAAGDGSDFV